MTDLSPSSNASAQRTRSVLSGSAALFGARVFGIVASLVSVGILTRTLGREEFGLWSVIGAFVGFAGNFDFGLGQGLKNKLAALAAREKRDPALEGELFFSVLAFLAVIAIVSAVLIGGLSVLVPWAQVLGVKNPALEGPAHAAVIAVVVLLLLNLPLNLNLAGFLAYQEAAKRSLFDVLQSTLLLLGVVFLAPSLSIQNFIAAYYVLFNLAALIALVVFVRQRGWSLPRLNLVRIWSTIKDLAGSSVQFWLLGVAAIALFTTDPIIAARVTGLGNAGDFSILQKLVVLLIGVHFTLLMPLWSAYTHAEEQGDWPWIRQSLKRSLVATALLFGLGGVLAVSFHGPVLRLWTGRPLENTQLVVALAVWAAIYAGINCLSILLNGIGQVQRQVVVILFCSIVHIPLSILLGRSNGVIGVVWGSVVSILPLIMSNTLEIVQIIRKRIL